MKSISFALALLAALGIVVHPVAPAYAVTIDEPIEKALIQKAGSQIQPALVVGETLDEFILNTQIPPDVRETLANRAGHGEAAILSQAQMNDLARTHPALHAKLMNAYRTLSIPKLTPAEKKLVDQMTAGNLDAFKAGFPAECGVVGATPVKVASAAEVGCGGSNNGGGTPAAWIVIALMLALIIGLPLFCTLFGNPPICRGFSGL